MNIGLAKPWQTISEGFLVMIDRSRDQPHSVVLGNRIRIFFSTFYVTQELQADLNCARHYHQYETTVFDRPWFLNTKRCTSLWGWYLLSRSTNERSSKADSSQITNELYVTTAHIHLWKFHNSKPAFESALELSSWMFSSRRGSSTILNTCLLSN